MTYKVSTGLRNHLLDTGSIRSALDNGFIKLYSGTPPASADDAIGVGNTLLCTISVGSTGTGITFNAAAASGMIEKNSGETWSGVNAATDTATFYRHVAASDDGTLSTTQKRVQGGISTAGSELNLSSTSLTSGATQTIDAYSIALPTL